MRTRAKVLSSQAKGVEIGGAKATSLVIGRALCRDGVAWLIDWTQNPESRMVWRLEKAHRQAAGAEAQCIKRPLVPSGELFTAPLASFKS